MCSVLVSANGLKNEIYSCCFASRLSERIYYTVIKVISKPTNKIQIES